jgi:hypothetical protein
MKELSAVALGSKVLVAYDLPSKGDIPEKFSFACYFDLFEYKDKISQIKRGESVVIDGEYGKIQVYKKGHIHEIQFIPDPIPITLKSGKPHKDLKI